MKNKAMKTYVFKFRVCLFTYTEHYSIYRNYYKVKNVIFVLWTVSWYEGWYRSLVRGAEIAKGKRNNIRFQFLGQALEALKDKGDGGDGGTNKKGVAVQNDDQILYSQRK